MDARKRSKIISHVTAVFLCVFLSVFFATTIHSVSTINRQAEYIRTIPYPISVSAGRVETLLVALQAATMWPTHYNTPTTVEEIKSVFQQIDAQIDKELNFIDETFLEDPAKVDELQASYKTLLNYQYTFIDLCEDPAVANDIVQDYVDTRITPLLSSMIETNNAIVSYSTDQLNIAYDNMMQASRTSLVVSFFMMLAVMTSLFIYLIILYRKSAQEDRLINELERALVTAENANASKSAFLSNMSHDIRTPMNAIVGLTTIAKSHLDDSKRVNDSLTRIAVSSKHLLGLINDILDMSKIESGKISLSEDTFSLPNLISEFVTIIQPQIRAKNIDFDVMFDHLEHELVIGDSMRIDQIMLNLVGNALKYTPNDGMVRLVITELESESQTHRSYQFTISDSGIGMSEEFLNRIFDPFERECNETTAFTEGSGLGMAITKNIIDLMRGTINVDSELGKGTTFTVVLPLQTLPDDTEDPQAISGIRMLVVDDDTALLEVTQELLTDMGVICETAANGRQGISLVERAKTQGQPYDIVLVDYKMSDLDGIATVAKMRNIEKSHTKYALMSAYDVFDVDTLTTSNDISSFISKPLYRSHLIKKIQEIIDHAPQDSTSEQESGAKNIGGRVLLVEDNALNSEIAEELIRAFGVDVELAFDGQRAIDMYKKHKPGHYNLIFMDCQMPRMNGLEATEQIIAYEQQNNYDHTPIVAMTANAFVEDKKRAIEVGMDGFMTKPIDITELERNLREYLS